jgi:sugar phosphate isomerase/epimerase
MLEYGIIQTRGFADVVEDGRVTGFSLLLRMPNYRGAWGSLVDGIDVTVDGHQFPRQSVRWTLRGRTYTLDELQRSTGVHWDLDAPATVTVPLDGGLATGVHDVEVTVLLRSPYIPAFALPLRFTDRRRCTIVPRGTGDDAGFRYGVSIYSLTGDINTLMTLEDALADTADMGATGFELLTQGIPGYPEPSTAWIDEWHRLCETYRLVPTNISSWVDNQMWLDRDLTVEEAAEQLARDLRLAHRLGFGYLRPKFGVTSPQLDPHPTWRETVLRNLDLAAELDVVINPEIHSPTPIQHPVTQNYVRFIEETGTEHFKLLIDTGIFQTELVRDTPPGFDEDEVPEFLRPLRVPMSDLAEVLPHVGFIQSKFFEIDDQLHDLHVPWADILRTLHDGGWTGWLSSEYEGRREPYRGREQLRRHHALLRTLAAELAPTAAGAAR